MRERRIGRWLVASAAVALTFAAMLQPAAPARAATRGSHCDSRFPDGAIIHDSFPEPDMYFSRYDAMNAHGSLRVKLRMVTRPVWVAGAEYETQTYNGTFPGPTLVVCPGDDLTVRVVNAMGTGESTNLHVHGLHVSPQGDGDNVFLEIPPGESQTYHYAIPDDHDPGSFWYHPHLHGYVAPQIFAGLSGAIIVRGGLDDTLAGIPQRTMMIQSTELCGRDGQSVPFALSTGGSSGSEPCDADLRGKAIPDRLTNERFTPLLINGALNPTVPIRPGQLQRWRIFNANNNRIVKLNLANQPMWVLARDGNTLPRMQEVTTLMIPPGSRREILVRGPSAGTYPLTALPFAQFVGGDKPDPTSKNGGPTPNQQVLTVSSQGQPADDELPFGALPQTHEDLRSATVDRYRSIVFSEAPKSSGGTDFEINGTVFDHTVTPITMKLDSVEQWQLLNNSNEWHTMHIHQNPFQVLNVDGRQFSDVAYEDNVAMPPCHLEPHPKNPQDPACLSPSVVVIRMRPIDFTGRFVFHCHVTNHEDRGMMMAVQVVRQPTEEQLMGSTMPSMETATGLATGMGMRIVSGPYGGGPVSALDK
jgi:FtsP/CotA-like multicopper oxidase with cupredoxin domain